jgi:prepilin-type N-terminal cleavage/methylation domain-containing protein
MTHAAPSLFAAGATQGTWRGMPAQMDLRFDAEQGFGLIELMISLAIASFLVLGLVVMVSNTQGTFTTQTGLAALNDKERFAADLFGNVIESAGYFTYVTPQGVVPDMVDGQGTWPAAPSAGVAYIAAQVVNGKSGLTGTTETDTLSVRFTAVASASMTGAAGSSMENCLGVGGTGLVYESVLSIQSGNLVCQVGNGLTSPGAAVVLIDGVNGMTILYGVDTAHNNGITSGTGSATEYIPASAMNTYNWTAIRSVKITLLFATPTNMLAAPTAYSQIFQVMYGYKPN